MDKPRLEKLYEQTLVLRSQLGERAAFDKLLQLYDAPLRYYVRRIVKDNHDADDIVQDVWLYVVRKFAELRNAEAFCTWLYKIARNKSFMFLRKKKRFLELLKEDELARIIEQNGQDDLPVYDEVVLHVALHKLSPRHAEVLVLRLLENMTYDEIAQISNCKIGTIRSRIYYAKQALGKLLRS